MDSYRVSNLRMKYSGFSQTHKIGNIAYFVFPYVCSFLLYLQHVMLVNAILNISGYNRITFKGYRLHWSSSFLMRQLKRSWQYWDSCGVETLWKTPISSIVAFEWWSEQCGQFSQSSQISKCPKVTHCEKLKDWEIMKIKIKKGLYQKYATRNNYCRRRISFNSKYVYTCVSVYISFLNSF